MRWSSAISQHRRGRSQPAVWDRPTIAGVPSCGVAKDQQHGGREAHLYVGGTLRVDAG